METAKPLEEQYLLRFQNEELGQRVRQMVRSSELEGSISVYFPVGSRVGTFTVKQGGQEVRYKVTQCDLPCVVETHKTEDNKLYYKLGDIGQVLLVGDEMHVEGVEDEPMAIEAHASPPFDDAYQLYDGLTPPTKNIRKRKFRKRPKFSKEDLEEARKEIVRMKNGGNIDNIELIPISDVDELYETPQGNKILTLKHGKPPICGGNTNTFTEEELDLLPEAHRLLAKAQVEKEFESHFAADLKFVEGGEEETEDHSDRSDLDLAPRKKPKRAQLVDDQASEDGEEGDKMRAEEPAGKNKKKKKKKAEAREEDAKKTKKAKTGALAFEIPRIELSSEPSFPNLDVAKTPMTAPEQPVDDEETLASIRSLRCKKVDIANEVTSLNSQLDLAKSMHVLEKVPLMKKRFETKIEKLKEQIAQKKLEMQGLDEILSKHHTL